MLSTNEKQQVKLKKVQCQSFFFFFFTSNAHEVEFIGGIRGARIRNQRFKITLNGSSVTNPLSRIRRMALPGQQCAYTSDVWAKFMAAREILK